MGPVGMSRVQGRPYVVDCPEQLGLDIPRFENELRDHVYLQRVQEHRPHHSEPRVCDLRRRCCLEVEGVDAGLHVGAGLGVHEQLREPLGQQAVGFPRGLHEVSVVETVAVAVAQSRVARRQTICRQTRQLVPIRRPQAQAVERGLRTLWVHGIALDRLAARQHREQPARAIHHNTQIRCWHPRRQCNRHTRIQFGKDPAIGQAG